MPRVSFVTTTSFPIGAVHEFRLTLGDESSVVLRGRVVRSLEGAAPDGSRIYVTGVQFIDDEPDGTGAVGDLIDKIT